MLTATGFAIFIVPVLFVAVETLAERMKAPLRPPVPPPEGEVKP
jgi:hypothetical protein